MNTSGKSFADKVAEFLVKLLHAAFGVIVVLAIWATVGIVVGVSAAIVVSAYEKSMEVVWQRSK